MWVRGAAIRPVPAYAVVDPSMLESIENELAGDGDEARAEIDEAFHRFERTQPPLAERLAGVLAKPLDETALALGYFLSIAVWMAFERSFPSRLREVSEEDLRATEASLSLEEELRAAHTEQPIELDDVVAIEQPAILAFVNEHVEAALDVTARAETGEERDVDVEDVHAVYRAILVMTLALSHAVTPDGAAPKGREMLA